ncbi:TPA: hypothetical protein OTT35_001182 [Citrobacter koseri]|nr:hypothetical protein [Citrobacter koseri]
MKSTVETKINELVKLGHELAKELHCAESAALISDLASQLEVQFARSNALAAENAGLNKFIAESCFVQAGEIPSWHQAIDHAPETPTTSASWLKCGPALFLKVTYLFLRKCICHPKLWRGFASTAATAVLPSVSLQTDCCLLELLTIVTGRKFTAFTSPPLIIPRRVARPSANFCQRQLKEPPNFAKECSHDSRIRMRRCETD